MSGYVLPPLARADIFDICSYIAEGGEDAADRVEQAIYDACAFLGDGPLRGHTPPDLTPRPLRFWTLSRYPNYTVVYRPETAPFKSFPFSTENGTSGTFSGSARDFVWAHSASFQRFYRLPFFPFPVRPTQRQGGIVLNGSDK